MTTVRRNSEPLRGTELFRRAGRRCKKGCRDCTDCGECRRLESFPYMSMNAKQTDPDDLIRLRDYLSERYTPESFVDAVYEQDFVQADGLHSAVLNTLEGICRANGYRVSGSDLSKLAHALISSADTEF